MRITPTSIPGVLTLSSTAHEDMRGSFQRLWCRDSLVRAGVDFTPVQASVSTNPHLHTLRGMHWQAAPFAEQKLVRCLAGAIWDVVLDLRDGGRHWLGRRLEEGGDALFLPRGVAHGFLTLTPNAVVEYLIDAPHKPEAARGVRWDDPRFAIDWPAQPVLMSERDRNWPDFHHG